MRDKINDDLKTAMKAGDKDRVGTLRLVNAAIKSADIDARLRQGQDQRRRHPRVIAKMIKQRRDSIEQFHGRRAPELADKEAAEIAVIEGYMPKQMSEAEAKAAIAAVIKETGAAGPKDMGKVMAALKAKYAGQMDFGKASGPHQGAAEVIRCSSAVQARYRATQDPSWLSVAASSLSEQARLGLGYAGMTVERAATLCTSRIGRLRHA